MNVWQYSIRRLLYMIPILLGVCLIVFVLFNIAGGDPAITMLGKHTSAKQIAELREELGLNKSFFMQYLDIVKSAVTFDFGRSWTTKQDIMEIFRNGAVPSLTVSLPGFVISTFLSIFISLIVAYYRGKGIDRFFQITCVALMSVSSLAFILFGQWLLAYEFGLFEISGYEPGFPDFVPYIILPTLIWIVLSIGPNLRFYRTIMLDEIYQDYVRTARAKGLKELTILCKHVLKNAMIPILTFVIIQLPFLILGALLLESFFGIPGLGGVTLDAINNSDFPVLKAITILISIAYVVFSLITDILYKVVDPRVKLG